MKSYPGSSGGRHASKSLTLGIAASLLSIGVTIGAFFTAPENAGGVEIWNGHRTVLVDTGIPEAEVLSALSAAGFTRVISESTQPVLVTDWAELVSMTLASARLRLVGTDPRRDSYIAALGQWFKASVDGKPCRVYYLPHGGRVNPEKGLRAALSPFQGRFFLPDGTSVIRGTGTSRHLVFSISCLVLLFSCFHGVMKRRLKTGMAMTRTLLRFFFRVARVTPWICLAAAGVPASPIALLFGLALIDMAGKLDLPFEELLRSRSPRSALDSLRRQKYSSPILLFTALLSLAFSPKASVSALLAFLGSVLAAAATLAFSIPRHPAGRFAFVPKPIKPTGIEFSPPSSVLAGLACAVIALWAVSALGFSATDRALGGTTLLPRPVRTAGSVKPNSSEARSRIAESLDDRLPDLADWLAHIAVQEALPLERVGAERVNAFESVSISRPGGDEDNMIVFDDAWARNAYRKIPGDSIEGMLAAQGMAVRAVRSGSSGNERPLAPIQVLRYILLLIPPLCGIAAGYRVSRGSTASGTRQEA
jgi:hypothetical protein